MDPAALDDLRDGRAHVRVDPGPGGWTLTVHCRDRAGLFADTAGLLAAHGLTVRRARLATVDGVAVDEWFVESPGGDAPEASRLTAGLARLDAGDRTVVAGSTRRRADPARGVPPLTAAGTSAFVLPSARQRRHRPRGALAGPGGTAARPGACPDARGAADPVGPHLDLRRADPRHLLRDRPAGGGADPGSGGTGRLGRHRRLRHRLSEGSARGQVPLAGCSPACPTV
uniref:ACT domain-containing protein n=1 Tax=Janibacter limosus TaxID=53458 RepID=A0AC61U6P9_9MICO|nr:ACT domain-containing protein [Janibacter limosus]